MEKFWLAELKQTVGLALNRNYDLHRKHTNTEPLEKWREVSGYCVKHLGKMIFRPIFSNQEAILSNLKPIATLQYKPEGPHVLFYMTTTKANLV